MSLNRCYSSIVGVSTYGLSIDAMPENLHRRYISGIIEKKYYKLRTKTRGIKPILCKS